MNDTIHRSRVLVGATSLIVGPALMSAGDLIHPAESMDAATQVAILETAASRWYVAHLLLFIGFLVLVPGILTLTWLTIQRSPAAGQAAQILMVLSVGAFSAVFVFEMLLGRFLVEGAGTASAIALLEVFQSARIFLVLVPALLAFFIGTAFFVVPMASTAGPFRWPALGFALGAAMILAEIVSAQVLLSQIGNVVIFVSAAAFALRLLTVRPSSASSLAPGDP